MRFTFLVEVEVERTTGKFASRDEIAAGIEEALNDADVQQISGDEGGEYETTQWDVTEQEQPKRQRRRTAR